MRPEQLVEMIEKYAGDYESNLMIFGVIVGAVLAGIILEKILSFMLIRWRNRHVSQDMKASLKSEKWRRALRWGLQALLLLAALPFVDLSPPCRAIVRQALKIWIVGSFALLAFNMVTVLKNFILSRHQLHEKDNLEARRIYTQLGVIERIAKVLIIFLGMAIILLTFERVRQVGISLLASAGILSIIVGFSAQKSLATLFAGIQIALTQPIRIDDVVIIYPKTFPELDPDVGIHFGRCISICGLHGSGGKNPGRTPKNPGFYTLVGRTGLRAPGHRCQGAHHRDPGAGQR